MLSPARRHLECFDIGEGGIAWCGNAAAYTPIGLDPSGRVHALDHGELTVFGH